MDLKRYKKNKICVPIDIHIKDWFRGLEKSFSVWPEEYVQHPSRIIEEISFNLHPGKVALLFSTPSKGAKSFLVELIHNLSLLGRPVLYSSKKMDSRHLLNQLASLNTGVPIQRLEKGIIFDNEFAKLTQFAGLLSDRNIFLAKHSHLDVKKIIQEMRLWKYEETERGTIILDDYLDPDKGRFLLLDETLQAYKDIAQECGVSLIINITTSSVENLVEKIKPCRNLNNYSCLKDFLRVFFIDNESSRDVFVAPPDNKRIKAYFMRIY